MTSTVKRGHIEFPADWRHVESRGSGPFITRVVEWNAEGDISRPEVQAIFLSILCAEIALPRMETPASCTD